KVADGLFVRVRLDVSKARQQLESNLTANVFDLLKVPATRAESRLQLAPGNRIEHRLRGSRQQLLQVPLRFLFIVGAQKGHQQTIDFRCFLPVQANMPFRTRRVAEPRLRGGCERETDLLLYLMKIFLNRVGWGVGYCADRCSFTPFTMSPTVK